jgi:CMP-N,N'-diacetyllegionaminic acid synthase
MKIFLNLFKLKNKYKILGVIPARGGSKGIKNKNLHNLNGKPLIYYSIEAARKSRLITDFVVSTDSLEIKKVSEAYGAEVPFIRPDHLSNDKALAVPTIQHAVLFVESIKEITYDYIVMLQPTAPLRTHEDIDNSLSKLIEEGGDGIISVVDVANYHPIKMKTIKNGTLLDFVNSDLENPPRQSLPPVYIVNGAIYATKRDVFINKNTFKGDHCIPFIMPQNRSSNIDEPQDFVVAEFFLNIHNEKQSNKE